MLKGLRPERPRDKSRMLINLSNNRGGNIQGRERLFTGNARRLARLDGIDEGFQLQAQRFVLHYGKSLEVDLHGWTYSKPHCVLAAVIE